MKTTIVLGNAHTPEAIEQFQKEHAEEIEDMIASGEVDREAARPSASGKPKAKQQEQPATREQRRAA